MDLFKEVGSGFNKFVDGVGNFFGGIGNTIKGAFDSIFDKGVSGIWDDYTGNTANRENIESQEKYNQEVWNRADTQYQRTVADLRAAGLSSQLAAGAPSTFAGTTAAPQRSVGNESQAMERLIGMITSMKKTNADVNLVNAQADKVKTEDAIAQKQLAGFDEYRQTELAVMGSSIALNNAYTRNTMEEGKYIADRNLAAIQKDLSDARYNDALIRLVDTQIKQGESEIALNNKNLELLGSKIITELKNQGLIDAQTAQTTQNTVNASLKFVVDYSTFKFKTEKGDSPDSTEVSSTQSEEALKEFKRKLILQGVGSLTSVVSGAAAGFGAALGLGGGKFFNKMFGMGETTIGLDPASFVR